jgi:hypothetical protein
MSRVLFGISIIVCAANCQATDRYPNHVEAHLKLKTIGLAVVAMANDGLPVERNTDVLQVVTMAAENRYIDPGSSLTAENWLKDRNGRSLTSIIAHPDGNWQLTVSSPVILVPGPKQFPQQIVIVIDRHSRTYTYKFVN